MRAALPLLLTALAVAACDGFSVPGFSSTPPTTLEPDEGYEPAYVDARPQVARISSLTIESTPTGVVVLAVGLPPFQEYWDPELVRVTGSDVPANTVVYDFRVRQPVDPALRGPERSREIHAGAFLTNAELRGIRRITVRAAANSQTRSR